MQESNQLAGKTAMVTGATGGIGSEICRCLASMGLNIIPIDINDEKLSSLCHELTTNTFPVNVNVADNQAVKSKCEEAFDEIGSSRHPGQLRRRLIQQQATRHRNGRVAKSDGHQCGRMLEYDSTSHSSYEIPRLGTDRELGVLGVEIRGTYRRHGLHTSKGAVVSLTFSVAREYAGDGITANAIAPCYVMSPMVSEGLTEDQRTDLLQQLPVGRFCQPNEIAHAVQFFISPLAGFITGEVLDMNGGLQFD